ncbi:hypothetical protein XMM379_003132 [Aliiroseovarius sp. xm-m-379]|uniref:hypothetical protein n=1 Tax=Aliiroseovarius sp. xm-m-379 TaxID=2651832 RepID=UPI00156A27B7|nr:hypothetical protein [Aliiroseovarius sp. xm-m-379]NRP26411.1 hypothetical protein [Aliiroseovarius sp. xm-m-379]NRP58421.1 hypothetical protein [Marinobacterium sp. xm-d-510]
MNPRTITVQMTFDPSDCVDTDAASYDPAVDLEEILAFGMDHYSLEDWKIIDTPSTGA